MVPLLQVTIEVLDDPPIDVDMDLVKEWSNEWPTSSPSSTVEWLGGKKLFWPLFWGYTDADSGEDGTGQAEDEEDDYDYDSGEPIPSGLGKTDSDWTHNHYGKCFIFHTRLGTHLMCKYTQNVRDHKHEDIKILDFFILFQ